MAIKRDENGHDITYCDICSERVKGTGKIGHNLKCHHTVFNNIVCDKCWNNVISDVVSGFASKYYKYLDDMRKLELAKLLNVSI